MHVGDMFQTKSESFIILSDLDLVYIDLNYISSHDYDHLCYILSVNVD
jgi:hypothetical protein